MAPRTASRSQSSSRAEQLAPLPPPVGAEELVGACSDIFDLRLLGEAIGKIKWEHRDRILTPEYMVMGLIRLVLGALPSLLNLMDVMRTDFHLVRGSLEFSNQAFYKRLRVMPHDIHLSVLREVTLKLSRASTLERAGMRALAPMAKRILAVDDTTLDAMARKTSSLVTYPKGAMETLAGRLSCAYDICTGRLAEVLYDPDAKANEKPHLDGLLGVLGSENMLVFDLGFFSFPLFDKLTSSGNFFVTRLRKGTSFVTQAHGIQTDVYRESLVYLGKHRADRASHPVRLVELNIAGQWLQYITNVLDPRVLPAGNIWKLYRQRWTIETVFAALKQALKLAYIHPCHTNGVLAQVWSTLSVYQVLQDLRLRIAAAHGYESDDVSWYNLVHRIGWYLLAPRAGKTLMEWLTDPRESLALPKRGMRERVPKELTGKLARDIKREPVAWPIPPIQEARQGKPDPAPSRERWVLANLGH